MTFHIKLSDNDYGLDDNLLKTLFCSITKKVVLFSRLYSDIARMVSKRYTDT